MGSRVQVYEAIRCDHRRDELSIRELAARHGVHRRTVRQALDSPTPPPRKPRTFTAPKLDPAKPIIDGWLREDLVAPRKQRHTARRVWTRLVDEHAMSYCRPGVEGAHEKGGVEGEGGRFRRNHLVPVPKVSTLAEPNDRLARFDRADDHRHIATRIRTVGEDYAAEAPLLRPLPGDGFETGRWLSPLVDRYSRVTVRQSTYSVPARFIGRHLRALLRADEVVVFDRHLEVARHERSTVKGSTTVVLDHYLEILVRKPGALPGAVALDQARRSGVFTAGHEAFWAAARAAHGDAAGTRELVEVLLLHRHLRRDDVLAGLRAATSAGATRADVVAVEARRLLDQ